MKQKRINALMVYILGCIFLSYNVKAQDIYTVAGNGTFGFSGDGTPATSAELWTPTGVGVDDSGNVYIADNNNNRIRKLNVKSGNISTVVGNGIGGFSGDGGLAISAEISAPTGVAFDHFGNMYIADYLNNRIRKVTRSTNKISTVAGNSNGGGYSSDGGMADTTELNRPTNVFIDDSGNVYIADSENNRIRKINTSSGIITTVAGNGVAGFGGDGGLATSAELHLPCGIALDDSGNIYIGDTWNNRVRRVSLKTSIITTVAGNGSAGYSGDGTSATSSMLYYPEGLAFDKNYNIYISDFNNARIRKLTTLTGIITTIAGDGTDGFSGDGGPAVSAELFSPNDVAIDTLGNLYIADTQNDRIRKTALYTGINTLINSKDIKVYPIPNSGNMTIQLQGIGNEFIKVYDLLGRELFARQIDEEKENQNISISLNNIQPGIYLLSIVSKSGVISEKIAIQ